MPVKNVLKVKSQYISKRIVISFATANFSTAKMNMNEVLYKYEYFSNPLLLAQKKLTKNWKRNDDKDGNLF